MAMAADTKGPSREGETKNDMQKVNSRRMQSRQAVPRSARVVMMLGNIVRIISPFLLPSILYDREGSTICPLSFELPICHVEEALCHMLNRGERGEG